MYEYEDIIEDVVNPKDYDWTQDVNGLLEGDDD